MRVLPFLLTLAALTACSQGDVKTLVLTGSSTIAPLAAEIGKRFERAHPGVQVNVQTGGSSRGIADARRGLNDIGMVSRALNADEQGLHAFTIARDGVGIIVNANNPVDALSNAQIVAIFTGQIENWQGVGGPDAPITVVNKAAGRATLEVFLEYFALEGAAIEADVIVGDNEQGIKTVAGNPHAIGYVSIGTAVYDAELGIPIKLLPLAGVPATLDNVGNGAFPMARPLNLVTAEAPAGLAAAFIAFARSAKVHDLIAAQYFVPITGR